MKSDTADPPPDSSHSRTVRITHALSSVSFAALIVSGFAILLAHPRLYWGEAGNFDMPAWVVLPIKQRLGHSGWGRSLHFLAAWVMVIPGMVYVISETLGGHFRKHLLPKSEELRPRTLLTDLADHLRWRARNESSGPQYNVLQKLSYLVVVFVGLPLMILTGLTMSPAVTAAYPALLSIFAGRQSARTIHFLATLALILFVVVHIVMVARSGFRRQLRSITLGEPPHE